MRRSIARAGVGGVERDADDLDTGRRLLGSSAGQFRMAAGQFVTRKGAELFSNFNALVSLVSLVSFGITGLHELRNLREPDDENRTIEQREGHISTSQPTASRKSRSSRPLGSVFGPN